MIRLRRWGFRLGPLRVTWTDLWAGRHPWPPDRHGLEVVWLTRRRHRVLIDRGFGAG